MKENDDVPIMFTVTLGGIVVVFGFILAMIMLSFIIRPIETAIGIVSGIAFIVALLSLITVSIVVLHIIGSYAPYIIFGLIGTVLDLYGKI